jgi:hypothetical protein
MSADIQHRVAIPTEPAFGIGVFVSSPREKPRAMTKALIAATLSFVVVSTVVVAAPRHRRPARINLASMNLTPTRIVDRAIPTRAFAPDRTPTLFNYNLPAPGMGAVVGYKPFVDSHPIQGYEVNQATAIGFSQPSSTVGAALDYKF